MKKGTTSKIALNRQQIVALLVTLRKELITLFNHPSDLDKVKDSAERKKRIIDDLTYLIKEGLKTDPEDINIYEIFNS